MEIERAKLAILESVVSGAVGKVQPKLEYWGHSLDLEAGTLYEADLALGQERLNQILPAIDLTQLKTRNQWALVGIGWEFVWGTQPPEKIIDKKQQLITRVALGMEITQLEELWLNLILVDTDIF